MKTIDTSECHRYSPLIPAMEAIEKRVAKAAEEMTFAEKFDCILVNDVLDDAFAEAEKVVGSFIRENRSCFRTIPSHSTQHSQK